MLVQVLYTHLLFYVAYHSNLFRKIQTEMQERMNNPEIAGSSSQPCVRSYDVVTKGTFTTISKNFNTIFFNKYLSPSVNCLLQTTGISLVKGSSLKLLAYSSELRVLDRGENSTSRDSVPHMDRTRGVKRPATHDCIRVFVYLADSVDSGRNFVTPEFGKACAVAQEHVITPLHVVLWTKAHNRSYEVTYTIIPHQKLIKEGFVYIG